MTPFTFFKLHSESNKWKQTNESKTNSILYYLHGFTGPVLQLPLTKGITTSRAAFSTSISKLLQHLIITNPATIYVANNKRKPKAEVQTVQ